jgi:alanyl-tRNA synthetase
MKAAEIRQKYLEFFASGNREHAIIPSASVVPQNDPTVLFTTAGMHPLVPYLIGEKHPQGKRLANSQKCIRTGDIDDVGDNRHLTFFEMLGNWSLGDYFKKEAIEWSFQFLTDKEWLGLDPRRIFVTVFAGDRNSPVDTESVETWKKQFATVGIEAGVCGEGEKAQADSRIFLLDAKDNWWGPAGETGPCGPCTEMFYDVRPQDGTLAGKTHEEWVDEFRIMEIWNDVFMEFNKMSPGKFEKMAQQNVDTGMGLERTITVLTGKENVFDTDLFLPIIAKVEKLSGMEYGEKSDAQYLEEKGQCWIDTRKSMRIVADHIKASVFIIADGIEPSNTERGYVLRRLIRRAIRQGHLLGIKNNFTNDIAKEVQKMYGEAYPEILQEKVSVELEKEEEKFRKTLERGLKEFEKYNQDVTMNAPGIGLHTGEVDKNLLVDDVSIETKKYISGKKAFDLYQSFGFPLEMIKEEAKNRNLIFGEKEQDEFEAELKKHQELSRSASAGMFKGGLADNKEETTQLHTAAHLMLAGLRKVLGDHVHQKGSNITAERLRFDFSHPDKMTEEQKKAVEDFVNEALNAKVPVEMKEMSLEDAKASGAEGAFENKYSEMVKIYIIQGFSNEICGGPHVANTGDIKGAFKIQKEESSSSGVRRIKAVIE